MKPVITSFLDTDMYKLTMHAAVFTHFKDVNVKYKYTNRSPQMTFNKEAIEWLKEQFKLLGEIKLSEEELAFIKKAIPYLPKEYLEFIAEGGFEVNPEEELKFEAKEISDKPGHYELDISIEGLWIKTIWYEIPVLALVSEAYFKFVDTDWTLDGQVEKAYVKTEKLLQNNIIFSEFGTRRRRSFETQDLVMQGILKAAKDLGKSNMVLGTSNVYFAKKYNIDPVGTVAHEWMMGIASITNDYLSANKNAMDYWIETFGIEHAGLALTDTFGTDSFLKSFYPPYSDAYIGVRQDSGDPVLYTKKIAHHYNEVLNLPKFSKVICYSDSLNPDRAIEYAKVAHENGLKATFGIGTNFTNDFQRKSNPSIKSEPLNIVIKLLEVNGNHAIKISDNLGKNMGDPETVRRVKRELGYIERKYAGDNEAHRWAA
ncbi:Nicotinate phosphoribosyltransferase [Kluyveromyces marxianus]